MHNKTESRDASDKAKTMPPAAKRALNEAAARKAEAEAYAAQTAAEIGGRKEGKEPTRYGDWEFKGRAIDF